MAEADSVAERVRSALGNTGAALDAVGQAFEQAALGEVPVHTGAGKASIRWMRTSETTGYLEFVGYLQIQATQRIALSMVRRNVAARARYAALVGRPIEHPNEWYQRAWASETVQNVIRQFPEYLFSVG